MSARRNHCRGCLKSWGQETFYASSRALCKECTKKHAREWHWRNKGDKTAERRRLVDDLRAMGLRQCKICFIVKPLETFGKAATTRDGFSYGCKSCITAHVRRKTYGLGRDVQKQLLDTQDSCCAICRAPLSLEPFSAHLDHDHHSGTVRGFLCPSCNRGLGHFDDDADRLFNAALYVLAHQKEDADVA